METGDVHPAFARSGEVPALARQTDWAATPFGVPERWSAPLVTAADICFGSRLPLMIAWGRDLTMLYNDAFLPLLGEKHPAAFAGPAGEIWPTIGPMLDAVRATDKATYAEDLPLRLRRAGALRDGYFTFSSSPIHATDGSVAGIFVATVETTERVVGTRRLATLSALARTAHAAAGPGLDAVCVEALRALAANPADLPLAGLYLIDGRRSERLAGSTGPPLPPLLDPADPPWPVLGAVPGAAGVLRVALEEGEGLLLGLGASGSEGETGHLVVGLPPHLALDEAYLAFVGGVAQRIGAELGAAQAIAGERSAAAALQREQMVLSEVIARAPAGICLWWGPEHRYRLVNRRYQEIVPVGDPIGRTLAEVLPEVAPIATPALDAVRESGQPERYEDLPLPFGGEGSIDGMRFYSFAISAVPDEDGGPGGVLGVTVETTDAVRQRSALEAELLDERRIAETLQRSLLPPTLPTLPGAALAARYEAAGERFQVGGDFYDAFENSDGTWTLVIGDVQGKGARAAALTATARYTIRAEAAHGAQPGRLVAMLNEELCRHRQPGAAFCTVVCATVALEARGARMRIAVAGHPAPIALRQGRGPHVIDRTGPLVGVMPDASWTDVRIVLGRGDAVVFYTDGLTEARAPGVILDPVDLAANLALASGRTADQLVSRLAAEMPAAGQLRDDYAILALSIDR